MASARVAQAVEQYLIEQLRGHGDDDVCPALLRDNTLKHSSQKLSFVSGIVWFGLIKAKRGTSWSKSVFFSMS